MRHFPLRAPHGQVPPLFLSTFMLMSGVSSPSVVWSGAPAEIDFLHFNLKIWRLGAAVYGLWLWMIIHEWTVFRYAVRCGNYFPDAVRCFVTCGISWLARSAHRARCARCVRCGVSWHPNIFVGYFFAKWEYFTPIELRELHYIGGWIT